LNPAFDQDFYSCLHLEAVLAIHDVPGGTAPARVRQALTDAKQRIGSIREEIHAHA
jgi:argininosuccinate lyase